MMRTTGTTLAIWMLLLGSAGCSKSAATDREPTGRPAPVARGAALELGKDTEVTEGKTYQVGDVAITVVNIGMASGADAQGNENHWIHMKLRVERTGSPGSDVELVGDEPAEAAGMTFHADALGYQWGATPATATLRVERK